jgi:hypothetical protein
MKRELPMLDKNVLVSCARQFVEDEIPIPQDADDDLKYKSNYSLVRRMLTEITNSAVNYAAKHNLSEEQFQYDLLPEARNIVREIQYAFDADPWGTDPKNWNFWEHQRFIIERIRKKDVPSFRRSEIEGAATNYLNSRLRAPSIDRTLIDGLVAMEVFAFGDEMLNPHPMVTSPLKRPHALWTYLLGQAGNLLLFGVIIAIVAWLGSQNILGATATGWSIGILVGLFLLLFLIATVSLPWVWFTQGKEKKRIRKLLLEMVTVYNELGSDGAISAHHIRHRAQETASQGTVWPATLFAMLDDVIKRTGRF